MHTLAPALREHWESALAFHRHSCPGLAMGCRIAVDALAFLGRGEPSVDEEIVCIAETDACAVDAIQVITGCTLGKGNLLLRPRGKHAFSFYARETERSVRFLWRGGQNGASREEKTLFYLTAPPEALYTMATPLYAQPDKALLSPSLVCAACGEETAEPHIRMRNGEPLCLDCYVPRCRVIL